MCTVCQSCAVTREIKPEPIRSWGNTKAFRNADASKFASTEPRTGFEGENLHEWPTGHHRGSWPLKTVIDSLDVKTSSVDFLWESKLLEFGFFSRNNGATLHVAARKRWLWGYMRYRKQYARERYQNKRYTYRIVNTIIINRDRHKT